VSSILVHVTVRAWMEHYFLQIWLIGTRHKNYEWYPHKVCLYKTLQCKLTSGLLRDTHHKHSVKYLVSPSLGYMFIPYQNYTAIHIKHALTPTMFSLLGQNILKLNLKLFYDDMVQCLRLLLCTLVMTTIQPWGWNKKEIFFPYPAQLRRKLDQVLELCGINIKILKNEQSPHT